MKIKIAVDQAVGRKMRAQLNGLGYEIVCAAQPSESDDSWMNRAFAEGAMFAVSPDLDIPRIIELSKYPMMWVMWPDNITEHKNNQISFVNKSIKHKLQFCKNFSVSDTPKVTQNKSWTTNAGVVSDKKMNYNKGKTPWVHGSGVVYPYKAEHIVSIKRPKENWFKRMLKAIGG